MDAPCVRVSREDGEATRQGLADLDLIDRDLEIDEEDGTLYIPVSDPGEVPGEYDVVRHDVDRRETQTLPRDLLDAEPTYERLGDVAIIDEDDPGVAREVAAAIAESDLPLDTVVNKRSEVKGEQRTRDWEVLEGEGTEVRYREYGCTFALDLARVYFSPRLATERHRVVEQVEAGEHAFDMFAGVGPFAIPLANRGARVVAVDVNGTAIEYLEENARRNDVADRVTAIHGDVRDVVTGSSRAERSEGLREVPPGYEGWADRVVMNLPHSAEEFVDAAVTTASDACTLHYYDIQPEGEPFAAGEDAIRTAAEPTGYDVSIESRRVVRSYSPREVNVCLDVLISRT